MAHRVAPLAEADLDNIWYYVATESGSLEIANRLIDSITNRFLLLSKYPYLGRTRADDFGAGSRTFAIGQYVILYQINEAQVLILRVVHGRRDLEALFGPR